MNGRFLVKFAAVLILGLPFVGQAHGVEPPKAWEYKVVSFPADADGASKQLNDLVDEGWEYVGLLTTSVPRSPEVRGQPRILGHESLVAFKRLKK